MESVQDKKNGNMERVQHEKVQYKRVNYGKQTVIHWFSTSKVRGVFMILLNICDGAFLLKLLIY